MKRESRQQPVAVGIGFLLLLFALNYAWASVTGFPIVYCAASGLAPLVAPVWQWLFWAALVIFIVTLFGGKPWIGAMVMVFLLGGAPQLLGALFLSFQGCGT